ncbi:hypothetical protein [Streptomyces sp. NPDC050485]|uniref:hypothetical protein n=1 Tax=Streptomyces sp. NPDC050485 TaxID=3365617 RepID=UPI003789A569
MRTSRGGATGLAAGSASHTLVWPRLALADTYAAAAFARGDGAQDWIEALDGYEALAVLPDGRQWRTAGLRRYGS